MLDEKYLNNFKKQCQSLPGSKVIQELREVSFNDYIEQGFPNRFDEQWKYTSVYHLAQKKFSPIAQFEDETPSINNLTKWYINIYANKMDMNLPQGMKAVSLSDALINNDAQEFLNKSRNTNSNSFNSLNSAMMNMGYYLLVEDNIIIDEPLHITFFNNQTNIVNNIHNILVTGDNSHVEIIEQYFDNNLGEYCVNTTTECFLGNNSKVNFYKFQEQDKQSYHIGHVFVEQKPKSSFKMFGLSSGSILERTYVEINLQENSHCDLSGLYAITNSQHADYNILVNHLDSHTTSNEFFKGVMDKESKGVFKGNINVAKNAQQVVSHQKNNNMLLSNSAHAFSLPQLDIYANDVQCSHGATVGQLDEDAIFYLRSRGLSNTQARHLLIMAFSMEVVQAIENMIVKKYIENKINKTINAFDLQE